MAFSPDNQQWVKDQIQTDISTALEKIEPPSGFKKALYVMRQWGVLAVDLTLIVTLAIFAATQWSAANNRLAAESAFQKGTEDRLKAIEQALKELHHPSPLQAFAKMDQAQLSHELGKIADVASEAHKSGVIDDIENIDAIQRKLAGLPLNMPDASRAVSSVINYASFVREKTNSFTDAPQVRESACEAIHIEHPPPIPTMPLNNFDLTGCTQRIDNGIIWRNGTFTHVIIIWDGNPIRLENVKFINCLFIVSLPIHPPAVAKQFADEILVKNTGPTPAFTASVG